MNGLLYRTRAGILLPGRDRTSGQSRSDTGVSLRRGDLDFEVISQRHELDALEQEWNALFERAGLPHQMFQTFNWTWHWCNAYYDDDARDGRQSLCILLARHRGKLVMIWPLMRTRISGITQLSWTGAPVSQYGDVLIEDAPQRGEWLRLAWRYIMETIRPDAICLEKVRDDAALSAIGDPMPFMTICEDVAPYVPLSGIDDFESYATRFSRRRRKTWNRLERRMAESGPCSVDFLTEGDDAATTVKQALAFKREWLTARKLVSIPLSDVRFDRFFLAAARSTERPLGLVVTRVNCGDTTAAVEVAISCKGRHAAHIGAMNMQMEQFRPGTMQIRETLSHCIKTKMAVYDFFAPGDDYKFEWADQTTTVRSYVGASTLTGSLYITLYYRVLKPLAKKALAILPQAFGRLVSRRTG